MNTWSDSFGSVLTHHRKYQAQTDSRLLVDTDISEAVLYAWVSSPCPSLYVVSRDAIVVVLIEIAKVPFSDLRKSYALAYLQHGESYSRDFASWAGALPLAHVPIVNSLCSLMSWDIC